MKNLQGCYLSIIFLLGTMTLSPIFAVAQYHYYHHDLVREQQIKIELYIIREAATSHNQREQLSWITLLELEGIEINTQVSNELQHLLNLTGQSDKLIDEICSDAQNLHYKCFPILGRIWLSNIELTIIYWADSSYSIRQKLEEPVGINTSNLSKKFQQLVNITREKDRIIREWYEENLPMLQLNSS